MYKRTLLGFALLITSALQAQNSASPAEAVAALLTQADSLHELKNYDETFKILKQAYSLDSNNVEVVWRLSRAYFDLADKKPQDFDYQKQFEYPGLRLAKRALALDSTSAAAHKWYAIHIGRVGEIEGTKQKILNSYQVREHILKAIKYDPTDDGNYHVMGRWHYVLADLSWLERQIASIIYATPPKASFEEAAKYFKKAHELAPDDIRNMLYLGHTYRKLDKPEEARKWYQKALAAPAKSESDRQLQQQAREALEDLD